MKASKTESNISMCSSGGFSPRMKLSKTEGIISMCSSGGFSPGMKSSKTEGIISKCFFGWVFTWSEIIQDRINESEREKLLLDNASSSLIDKYVHKVFFLYLLL